MEILGDDTKDVAKTGYTALMKGEHRVYDTTKVKLMHTASSLLPNILLACATHVGLEKDN